VITFTGEDRTPVRDMHKGETVECRIGVYICHCGTNIAGTVDVAVVTEMLMIKHPFYEGTGPRKGIDY